MKKLLMGTALALTLAFLLAGCQKEPPPQQTALPQQGSPSVEEPGAPPEEASALLSDPGIATDGSIDSYLDSFTAQLAESGLTLEGKAVKDAASIGASEGYGFQVNGAPVEVYLFDPGSGDEKTAKNLKTAEESGFITIFGVEINGETPRADCTLHENLVLLFPAEAYRIPHPDKESIVKAFMKIST